MSVPRPDRLGLPAVPWWRADPTTAAGGSGGGQKIALLLLPESKTTRYEALDRPLFTEALKADLRPTASDHSNADQDAAKQQQQAEAALTQVSEVLVLDQVDGKVAAAPGGPSAKGQNVPVVAYDRFIENADYYVSFENEGSASRAQTLVDALKAAGKTSGNIAMINGSPTDPNAADFKKGTHSVLDSSGFKVAAEFDTPDWARTRRRPGWKASSALIKRPGRRYAANDGTAGGAIAALKGRGVTPLPPVTGQDSTIAAIQRIVAGDQAMTRSTRRSSRRPRPPPRLRWRSSEKPAESTTDKNGVPSTILDPVVVT